MAEYEPLKADAARQSASLQSELDDIQAEDDTDSMALKTDKGRLGEIGSRIQAKQKEMEIQRQKVEQLAEDLDTQQSAIDDERRGFQQLENEVC